MNLGNHPSLMHVLLKRTGKEFFASFLSSLSCTSTSRILLEYIVRRNCQNDRSFLVFFDNQLTILRNSVSNPHINMLRYAVNFLIIYEQCVVGFLSGTQPQFSGYIWQQNSFKLISKQYKLWFKKKIHWYENFLQPFWRMTEGLVLAINNFFDNSFIRSALKEFHFVRAQGMRNRKLSTRSWSDIFHETCANTHTHTHTHTYIDR